MKLASFDLLVRALEQAGMRYLAAFAALEGIGYRPLVPVTAVEFADPAKRSEWIREKGMTVLNFWCDEHRDTPIDVFVTEPFAFDEEYARALVKPLNSIPVHFVSIPSLSLEEIVLAQEEMQSLAETPAKAGTAS